MEPRRRIEWLNRDDRYCTFLGGTPEFDIWYFSGSASNAIRLVDDREGWDEWITEMLPPRGVGYFKDITLTPEQAESIETYLRCFAPWVLASRSEEQT
jgi:hypothetical protein